MASLKTGALFALPARCLALFAQQKIHTTYLHKILLNMAVAYQIKDDQSDFSCIKTGRKLSSDLKNGRPNLYNLYAEYNMSSAEIFTQIQDYHDNLLAQSVKLCESMPHKVRLLLENLLFPFVRLKPIAPNDKEVSVGHL